MTSTADVDRLLRAVEGLPHGVDRVRAAEEAVTAADDSGDFLARVHARYALHTAYVFGSPSPQEFTVAAWLTRALEQPEVPLPDDLRHSLLWNLKFVLSRLRHTSSVPLDVLLGLYDDIEQRLAADGFRHATAVNRALLQCDIGTPDDVAAATAVMHTTPRDELSDCPACSGASECALAVAVGDTDGALTALLPTLNGTLLCQDEPAFSQAVALDLLMRAGRTDEAVAAHVASWRELRERQALSSGMIRHLVWLARTGRPERAWRLLGPRLCWIEDIESDLERMEMAAGSAAVIEAGRAAGVVPDRVGGEDSDLLAAELREISGSLAAAFDARNGTTNVSRRLAALVDLTPYDDAVELPTDIGSAVDAATRLIARGDLTTDAHAVPDALPDGVISWRAQVEHAIEVFDPVASHLLTAWRDHRADQPAPTTPTEWAAAAYLDRRVTPAADSEDPAAERRTWLERALDEATHGDDDGLDDRIRVDLAALDAEEGTGSWDAVVDLVRSMPADAPQSTNAMTSLGDHPDSQVATAWLERAAQAFGRDGSRGWQAVTLARAGWRALDHDPVAAESDARVSLSLLADVGAPRLSQVLPYLVFGVARAVQGRPDEAVEPLTCAIDLSRGMGEPAPVPALMELCAALAAIGDWPTLLTVARRGAGEYVSHGEITWALRSYVGVALLEIGRAEEAAALLEDLLPEVRAQGSTTVAPTCRTLGRALERIGDAEAARQAHLLAAEAFEEDQRFQDAARAYLSAAELTWDVSTADEALPGYERAGELAFDAGDLDTYVGARRGRAAALAQADLEGGLAALTACVDDARRLAAAPHCRYDVNAEALRGSLLLQGARLCRAQGRSAQAVDLAVAAQRHATQIPAMQWEAQVLQASGLAALDRADEAEPLLRQVLDAVNDPDLVWVRIEAARVLAILLDDTGRVEQANAIWEQYGLGAP
ncbi:hypothetical protein KEM60_01307 [Austwickia sp. TVS 96-490-7B]|uniref:hypothetical protein n=1 Tax=Austwickia sp. TVS 96-490-7B TaxID=2830843 RepID=UPI001C576145|nr:hypothetical protein [Austwickia sp. TVS 96-490-7B]MBW3085113.1 hypothetical protein [Austwickia sp. TVS 96-490-7B]